ncbi:MAG: GNAT family N-acetyltransferase [Candidatus Kariarchaeaceae archaeon]
MELRKLTKDDYINWELVTSYSFSYTRRIDQVGERYLYLNPEQAFGIFINDKLAAGGYRFHFKQNIRGKIVDMGGIAAVATAPEYRRQGYVRQIMDAHFYEMKQLGQKISVIYPFKPGFYERMGYAVISPVMKVEMPINRLRNYRGKIEYERYDRAEGGAILQEFHREKIVPKYHGMIDRSDSRWQRKNEKNPGVVVVAKVDDEIIAAAAYTISGYEGVMESKEFFWTSVKGREALLGWVARHVDQVKTFKTYLPPNENIGYWMDNFQGTFHFDSFAMGRIIDIDILNGIPTQGGIQPGVIQVVDEQCQWNNRTIKLKKEGGRVKIEDSQENGERVNIMALAAALYGAVSSGDLVNQGWATDEGEKILLDFFPKQEAYIWDNY